MKHILPLILIGPGNIGRTVIEQISSQAAAIRSHYNVDVQFTGIFSSRSGIYQEEGIDSEICLNFREHAKPITDQEIREFVKNQRQPGILIDTSASPDTYQLMELALNAGGYVVASNKKPFASGYPLFEKLYRHHPRIFFETTVGAGLPLISTITDLIETGDEILEINGSFSGTLGFLFTKLSEHMPFSKAVKLAMENGYTEPDPRDDLSGLDVARKALIISRLMGIRRELTDISLQSLFPEPLSHGSVETFMQQIKTLDEEYAEKMVDAHREGKTYKYVASVSHQKCIVGMQRVDEISDIGSLRGPDNIIVIKTKRYFDNPLVIKGPGAGLEVTAAGVFADVLKIIRRI